MSPPANSSSTAVRVCQPGLQVGLQQTCRVTLQQWAGRAVHCSAVGRDGAGNTGQLGNVLTVVLGSPPPAPALAPVTPSVETNQLIDFIRRGNYTHIQVGSECNLT